MTSNYSEHVQDLWIRWRDAQQVYLASEQSLHAFETRLAPLATGRPHELIERARRLRQDRDRALANYQSLDTLFIAMRDAQILEEAAS